MNDCKNYIHKKCGDCQEYGGGKKVGCYEAISDKNLFHECPLCNFRCNCDDQPCSCCNEETDMPTKTESNDMPVVFSDSWFESSHLQAQRELLDRVEELICYSDENIEDVISKLKAELGEDSDK